MAEVPGAGGVCRVGGGVRSRLRRYEWGRRPNGTIVLMCGQERWVLSRLPTTAALMASPFAVGRGGWSIVPGVVEMLERKAEGVEGCGVGEVLSRETLAAHVRAYENGGWLWLCSIELPGGGRERWLPGPLMAGHHRLKRVRLCRAVEMHMGWTLRARTAIPKGASGECCHDQRVCCTLAARVRCACWAGLRGVGLRVRST